MRSLPQHITIHPAVTHPRQSLFSSASNSRIAAFAHCSPLPGPQPAPPIVRQRTIRLSPSSVRDTQHKSSGTNLIESLGSRLRISILTTTHAKGRTIRAFSVKNIPKDSAIDKHCTPPLYALPLPLLLLLLFLSALLALRSWLMVDREDDRCDEECEEDDEGAGGEGRVCEDPPPPPSLPRPPPPPWEERWNNIEPLPSPPREPPRPPLLACVPG